VADSGGGMSANMQTVGQLFTDAGYGWLCTVQQHSSWQSAATSEIVKSFWSQVRLM